MEKLQGPPLSLYLRDSRMSWLSGFFSSSSAVLVCSLSHVFGSCRQISAISGKLQSPESWGSLVIFHDLSCSTASFPLWKVSISSVSSRRGPLWIRPLRRDLRSKLRARRWHHIETKKATQSWHSRIPKATQNRQICSLCGKENDEKSASHAGFAGCTGESESET